MNRVELSAYRVLARRTLFVLLLFFSPFAIAQGFFRVSPGPLNEGHAFLDHSEGCQKCHVSGEGVTNARCLACHGAVAHKGGLHGTFGGKACIKCHTEHKGKAFNIINWGDVGGKEGFNHELAGFSLKNHHGDVACTQCHVKRLKTGRISYLGLSRDCLSCHKGVHGLTRPSFQQKCDICHKLGRSLKGQVLRDWQSEHATYAQTVLDGTHSDLSCKQCHEDNQFASRARPRGCAACHAPSHPVTPAVQGCANCHAQGGKFKGARVNHTKYGFALTGKHAKVNCAGCHRRGRNAKTPGQKVSAACASCHQAPHPIGQGLANCTNCHPSGGSFKGATIEHAKYGLPLLGAHEKLTCAKCHKNQTKLGYEDGNCWTCHTHRSAHQGQYKDVSCSRCHLEGGTRKTPFDHNLDTKFPLDGYHAEDQVRRNCRACHPKRIYRTGMVRCVDCHEDKHHGEAGSDCTQCHATNLHFNAPRSKEIAHEKFPLEGKHKTIACISCHVGGKYKIGKKTCYDCHAKDDKHRGKLGQDCAKCHMPVRHAPKFNHERMTKFSRTGAHQRAACASCHQVRSATYRPATVVARKRSKAPGLDLTFPVLGKQCVDCHDDPHHGALGRDCGSCHTTTRFEKAAGGKTKGIRPKDHGGAWLRRHTTLPEKDGDLGGEKRSCAGCHGTPTCTHCHRTRTPRSHTAMWRIRTHGSQASYDSQSCSTCHAAASCNQCHRRTRPLNHRGAWRTAHGYAAGGFGDSNCFVCHRKADCALCHRGS